MRWATSRGVKCSRGSSFSTWLHFRMTSPKMVPIVALSTASGSAFAWPKRCATWRPGLVELRAGVVEVEFPKHLSHVEGCTRPWTARTFRFVGASTQSSRRSTVTGRMTSWYVPRLKVSRMTSDTPQMKLTI